MNRKQFLKAVKNNMNGDGYEYYCRGIVCNKCPVCEDCHSRKQNMINDFIIYYIKKEKNKKIKEILK